MATDERGSGRGRGIKVVNNTCMPIQVELSQVTTLYQHTIVPGESHYFETGKVWFTVKAKPAELTKPSSIGLKTAAVVGVATVAAVVVAPLVIGAVLVASAGLSGNFSSKGKLDQCSSAGIYANGREMSIDGGLVLKHDGTVSWTPMNVVDKPTNVTLKNYLKFRGDLELATNISTVASECLGCAVIKDQLKRNVWVLDFNLNQINPQLSYKTVQALHTY